MRDAYCKRCRKPIVWARNPVTNRNIPIDRAPTIYKLVEDADGNVSCYVQYSGEFGVNHFTTCPYADEFHKAQEPKPEPLPDEPALPPQQMELL